jgi:hypothetical protein
MNPEWIKFIGIGLNVFGSIILAIRVINILNALGVVTNCHEENFKELTSNRKAIVQFTGSTKHVDRAKKLNLLIIGFGLIIIGTICQGISTYVMIK